MSKNIKSNNKNTKKSASKAKKSTRNNYKIESLEPRLMMDADVNLDEFESQFDSISSVVESSISSVSDLDLSSLGLDSKLDSASELISNAGDTIKTKIEEIYSSYRSSLEDTVESVKLEDLVLALNDRIGTLPPDVSELSFVQKGNDTIKVNFKYNGSVNTDEWKVPNVGLNADGKNFAINATADLSISLDLDKDDNGTLLNVGVNGKDAAEDIDFTASVNNISVSVPNVGVAASFMNVSVIEEDDLETDLEVSYAAGNSSSKVDLEFSLDVANSNLPFELETGKYIEITKPSGSSQFEVDFPEVSLKKSLSALLGSIDTKKLPFLNGFSIPFFDENGNAQDYSLAQISDLVKSFDEYWARASLALNGIVETGKMKFGDLQNFFDVLIEKKRATVENIFDSIKIYGPDSATDFATIFANSSSSIVASGLTELTLGDKDNKKTLTLEFSPNLGNFSKKIDFKLFKLENFDLNATLKIDVNVWLDDEGKLCFEDISLNDFTIKMSKSVDAELQLGLFTSDLQGDLTYTISANASGLKDSTLVLHCDSANLKSGPVEIVNVSNSDFTFNMVESVWEFPEEFKQYLALSGETLANNVAIYLNSLRTALRNLIEDKVKLDFLGDSAGSLIADSIAKIDAVIGGGKVKLKDGTDKEINGLFKVDGASLVANFNSVEEFVGQFNDAWSDAFELTHADYCLLKYIGENKNDKTVIERTKAEFESLENDVKSLFDFDHYSLVFELNFDILKTLDLNLVDALGNSFANVSTYGAVSANGSAGIKFSLDVNFSHEKINDDPAKPTKIEDFWGSKPTATLPANEKYYEVDLNGGFNGTAKFDVLEYDKNANTYKTIDSVVLSGIIFTTAKSSVGTYLEDNRVIITRGNKEFELSSSENQQAYAELGLGGSTLQTTATEDVSDTTPWSKTLKFKSKDGGTSKDLVIDKTVLDSLESEGIIASDETDNKAKLKDLLNQYLNLQRNDECIVPLGMKDASGNYVVEKNRTIMNTFGLYVVSVTDAASGSGYTIRFGCDPSRIQGYDENKVPETEQYDLIYRSGKLYMRISNVLKKTGVIGNNNGLMLEKYAFNATGILAYDSEYLDLSSITAINESNLYDNSNIGAAKTALETAVGSLTIGTFGVQIYDGKDGLGNDVHSLGVSANDHSAFIYRCSVDASISDQINLDKCRIENGNVVVVETRSVKCDTSVEYTTSDEIENANEIVFNLNTTLNNAFNGAFIASLNTTTHKIEITPVQKACYQIAMSNNILEVFVTKPGATTPSVIRLNTQDCRDLTSLAQAIMSAAEKKNVSEIHSVAVQGDKIVFAVAEGSTIAWSCSSLLLNDKGSDDFSVDGTLVDFETLEKPDGSGSGGTIPIDETWTIDEVVEQINNKLGSGVTLEYFDRDESGNPVIDPTSGRKVYWDHLEFRSKNAFELVNLGSSVVLDKLGFTAKKAVKYADDDYRIIGRALLGVDWSKLIDFTSGASLNVYANATLEMGQTFKVLNPAMKDAEGHVYSSSSDFDKADRIVFESDKVLNFVVNGLVRAADDTYYKIIDIEIDTKKSVAKVTISKFAEGQRNHHLTTTYIESNKTPADPHTKSTNEFRYMGGAVATVGFVDVNLVASGTVGFDAAFDLNVFDPNTSVKDNVVQNYELLSPDASVTATAGLKLDVDSFVDIGDKISEGLAQVQVSIGNDGKFDVSNNLNTIVSDAISKFGSFSAEDLFAILDSLVKRLTDIADKSNVKIPVINKSVSDLVDVANNIRDIVTNLRTDKVFSLQGLNDRLNKYFKDFGLLAHDGVGNVLDKANPFEIKIVGNTLSFTFNIDKKFDTVHQFSFGDESSGVSGNADLTVTGDFWFSLSANAVLKNGSFDLNLDKAIEFGANVEILGEKLSFNLGLDGVTDVDLLANLITVGSNKSDSYVYAQASLMGAFGSNGLSLKSFDADKAKFDFAVPVVVMGKLPISVCNMSLGDVLLGIGNDGVLSVGKTADEAKTSINGVLPGYVDYWKNKIDDDGSNDIDKPAGLIDFESLNPTQFFKLITDSNYSGSAGKLVADFSDVYKGITDLINGNVGWFEKIKLAITGFNKLFDTLEASLNSGMMSSVKEVPLVGNALSGGVDFLGDLKRKVLEPLSNFLYESTGMNAEMVAQKLNELFGTYLHPVSVDARGLLGDSWLPASSTGGDTYYREGTNSDGKKYAEWFLSIGDDYSYGTDIGFDLGFPGLGLKSDAGVNLNLGWRLDFGFGVSEDGFYFIFNDGNEVQVDANVAIEGNIMGSLAGLGLQIAFPTGSHPVTLGFGVDLDSANRTYDEHGKSGPIVYGANQLDFSNFTLGNIDFNYDATVALLTEITVGIVSDLDSKAGDAPKFPNLSGMFEFNWSADKGVTKLGFNDFYLDMGSFIGGVLGPIVSKIQKVVEPLEPLIDFLTTPFPVLDDLGFTYTPLSLAKQFSKGKFDDRMVYAVKDLIEISKKITAFASGGSRELKIALGSMTLIGGQGNKTKAESLLKGTSSNTSLDQSLTDYLAVPGSTGAALSKDFSSVSREASSSLMSAGLNVGDSAWRFVWDNPTDVFKLLLGQDIMLVEYDMPKLSFNFDWSTFVRIYGPLGARIGLSLGASIDLGFGYDTLGIRQWISSGRKDYTRLLNGFYVNDLRDGVDIDELSFHGALTAAAELNAGVSAGVGGGVGINVGFNLYDPNKDGKIRLNEIKQLFNQDGLFGIFDVNGKITAKLYAYVDLLFYTKEWNITGDKTLFKFEYSHSSSPMMNTKMEDGNVVANVGDNASSRVADDDGKYPLIDGDEYVHMKITNNTITDDYGHETHIDDDKIYFVPSGKGDDKIILEGDANFDIEIESGDGNDYIDLSKLKMVNNHYVLIKGGAGVDSIIGAQGLNIIFGDEGALRVDEEIEDGSTDKVYRLVAETDVNANKAGGDVILGGSGHDIIFGGAGNDQIDGGAGIDYIFGDSGSWSVKTGLTESSIKDKSPEQVLLDALHDVAQTNGVTSNIVRDNVRISRTDMGLDGGDDKLIGGDGDDVIHGGGGNDHIDGGADNDEIRGEKGHDRILGGSGVDFIYGGEGMDIIFGDRFDGTSKNVAEPFAVDAKNEKAAFSKEFIEAQFGTGTSLSASEFAFDSDASSAIGKKIGSLTDLSSDSGNNADDTIFGEDGNDLIFGDDGSDTTTDGGVDKIYGGIGNDIIDGDGGNDTIEGGIDNDIIYGGKGNDIIDGGAGNDSIYGDNGVNDYKKKTGTTDVDANPLNNGGVAETKIVFGDNAGLHGVVYADAESESTDDGNDTIKTGPGMDFVDGQGGSDKITVKLMGDSTTNYANVTDSGTSGADTLVVEGTESVDRLLLRQNKDQELGLVALLPMDEEKLDLASKNNQAVLNNLNSNIERINYTAGIENLNVNANGGNDQIFVDGTAHKTNIDGGAGNDNFYVGQIYNSERKQGGAAAVQQVDEFNTQKNNEEGYLSDGVSAGTVLNIEGGSGEDNFVALNNVGTLSMSGGKDNDNFSMYSFRKDGSGDAFERGAVLIDGGKGDDTLKVRGTDNDDVFVVTKQGMLSDLIAINASGVENSQFDAAAGDDMFHVVANNADDMTELYGGKGNDTFSMGGLDQAETLRSANTDGQSVNVKYEFLTDEGLTDAQKAELDQSLINDLKSNGAIDESFTVVDSDTEAAVFIVKNVGTDAQPEYQIQESAEVFLEKEFETNADIASFFVGCAGLASGKTLDVTISAPVLSTMDFNRGDCGFQVSEDGVNWDTTVIVHPTAGQPAKVFVRALADALVEEGVRKSIAITSEVRVGSTKNVLTKSVNSVSLIFKGENKATAQTEFAQNPLTSTEEFNIGSDRSFKVSAIPESGLGSNAKINFYVDGELQQWVENTDYTVVEGVVTIINQSIVLPSNGVLTINVRSKTVHVDDSRVSLAYEDVKISTVKIGNDVIPCGASSSGTVFYELNGNVITFYNFVTKQPMTVHGEVTVDATLPNTYLWEQFDGAAASTSQPEMTRGLLKIDAHDTAIAETSGSVFNSITYNVTFVGTIATGKKVFVKISPTELLANSNADEKSQRLSISCAGFKTEADGSIILSFDSATLTHSITVSAVADGESDDYGLTEVAKQDERIEEIDGPVYAYGYGESMNLDIGDPAMLNYRHVIETSAQGAPGQAANYNELNNFEQNKLLAISVIDGAIAIDLTSITDNQKAALQAVGIEWYDGSDEQKLQEFLSQFSHKSFKWTNETQKNFGTQKNPVWKIVTTVATAWSRIESASVVSDAENPAKSYLVLKFEEKVLLPSAGSNYALISVNRDSLFVDEMASVDRLFVNNQKSDADSWSVLDEFVANGSNSAETKVDTYDTHALRFTHGELDNTNGITAAQMEYGEYNLGTGRDYVEINKTLYRDDAFRTFTVVNTGDDKRADKDTNTVDFGYEIGTGSFVSRSETEGAEAPFHYNFNDPEHTSGVNVTDALIAENIYYVEAIIKKLKNGSTTEYESTETRQRREIVGEFSSTNGFNIKYDFILADDEAIEGFVFYCAEFDDEIVIKSHQSDREDENSTVICSGTKVSKNVSAPAEESAATETPVVSGEPVAEGDSPVATEETGAAESETSAADTPAETETTGEEGTATADAEKPAGPSGNVYSFTMNAENASSFNDALEAFNAAKAAEDRATNGYAYCLYVDATMSDGSVQRRVVNGMTENTFGIDRDFTLSDGVTIVSVKFAYNYTGDGQLVINAQSGNDKIDASSNDVTRNDMVVFGGLGDDYITMNKGGIAFGDRGQVKYDNGQVNGKDVHETVLGSILSEDGKTYYGDYTTGIDKRATDDAKDAPAHRLQTDGVNRDAKDIHSVDDSNGGVDMIYVGGTNSVVIGGAEGDVIAVGGNKNVVLGDNGRVNYKNATNANAVYGDELGLGLYKVETTSDAVGDVDNIVIAGNKNVAMGGDKGDSIRITGADNVAIGDAGRYTVEKDRLYAESKQESDHIGGKDYISTGDGKNAVIGGTDNDKIRTGAGNDAIIGDGGIVIMDTDRNMLMVSNEGRNINKQGAEDGSAGVDDIEAGDGDNVVFGGLNKDYITTGSGKDVAFGDNGYATFRGNANEAWYKGYDETRPNVHDVDSTPTIYSEATLSFNFQGPAQNGIGANEKAGTDDYAIRTLNKETNRVEEATEHAGLHVGNWNNIKGHEAGTYGDNDDEIVLFDNGSRASAVSVTYGASEDHRVNTTDGDQIRLHGYTQEGRFYASNSGDYNLMKSGLDTSGNNARNVLLTQVDGLNQYFTDYDVVVYLDMVRENSWAHDSVRVVTLYRDYVENGVARSEWVESYYVNDPEDNSFNGKWVVATATSAKDAKKRDKNGHLVEQANCVIFKNISGDRFHVEITDGDGENGYNNGKDRAGIAGIQVKGRLHKQDVAASTDIVHGGNDNINTQGGDDVVVGGTGADKIRTFGDDRYGIYDNDVVYGDNAKMVFTDRDSNLNTASTISYAESIASKNQSVSYDDKIMSGNGNDVVVGGSGSDKIDTGATAQADEKLDGLEVFSLNFTDVSSNQSTLISKGESAGVVVDNDWHNGYLYNGQSRVHEVDRNNDEDTEKALQKITFQYDCYGNTSAPTEVTNASMDADTGNNKMMMNYVGGHNQDSLTVRLNNIPEKFTANKYDVYVYIDGINNDSDAHGYVFKITGPKGKTYYLNDWSGNRFDGEFKEVTCTEYNRDMFKDGVTPSVEMIGNYVVFRDVDSKEFTVTLECFETTYGTQRRNDLPVISAVQLVAGANRKADIAVGGDHDKDFVVGDDATLHFDLDIPFAGDESIGDYQNRLVSAKSTSVSGSANSDKIWTGKDRDVVIGGEGNDQIDAGAGDDVVIGNTVKSVYVEHNNPVGVFRPNVNIVLEDNDYNVAEPRPYLDGQGGNKDQIRSMVQGGQIEGIKLDNQNTGYDTVYGGNNNKDLVFINGHTEWGNLAKEMTSDSFFGVQKDDVHALPTPPAPAEVDPVSGGEDPVNGGENPVTGNEDPVNGNDDPVNGNDDPVNGDEPQNQDDCSRTVISSVAIADLTLVANEKVRVVFEKYPQFTDHIANLHLYFTGKDGKMFEDVTIELYSHGKLYRYDVHGGYWVGVDVQDRIDGESDYVNGNCVLYVISKKATAFTLAIGE